MTRKIYFIGILLVAFFSFVYIHTLSKNWLFDSLFYAYFLKIDSNIIYMQHLLYLPLAQLIRKILQYLGFQIDPLIFLQTISAILGAAAVGIFYLLLLKIIKSIKVALVVSMIFGFSNFFWLLATQAENYTLAFTLLFLGLFFLESKQRTFFHLLCSAFFLALATLINFVCAVIILITFLCYFLVGPKKTDTVFISIAYIIITALAYVLVLYIKPTGKIIEYFKYIGSSWGYIRNFMDIRLWLGNLLWFFYALVDSIDFGFRSLIFGKVKFIPNVFYLAIFTFLSICSITFFIMTIIDLKYIVRQNILWFWWAAINLIVFYLLILWWEPYHPKKYFFCLPALLMIVALGFYNRRTSFFYTVVIIAFCIFLGINNYKSMIQEADIDRNQAFAACVQLNELFDNKECIVILKSTPHETSLLRIYLPYFFEYDDVYNLGGLIKKDGYTLDKFKNFLTQAEAMGKDIYVSSEVFNTEEDIEKQYAFYIQSAFDNKLIWQGSMDGKKIKIYKLIYKNSAI